MKKWPEFTLQQGDRDRWAGQWGQVASTSKLLPMNYWDSMKETHFFTLCFSLSATHLLLLSPHAPSSSLSPSCRRGIELLRSRRPTCGRTRSPPARRARRASETPLWKVRVESLLVIFLELIDSFIWLSFISKWRFHFVWDWKAASRLHVVSTGSSEPRTLVPRPPKAFRCVSNWTLCFYPSQKPLYKYFCCTFRIIIHCWVTQAAEHVWV